MNIFKKDNTKDENKKICLDNSMKDVIFMTDFGKIKFYYKQVLNVDIQNVYLNHKNQMKINELKQILNDNEQLKLNNNKCILIDFIIYFKDNNNILFKNKILKGNLPFLINFEKAKDINIIEKNIMEQVDSILCKYCIKKYLNNISNNKYQKILNRNTEIQRQYNNYISQLEDK